MPYSKKVLAIDWGERHLGFALYQPGLEISELEPVRYRDRFEFTGILRELIHGYGPEVLLVGDLGRGVLPSELNKLVHALGGEFGLEVVLADEKYSSFQAEEEYVALGGKSKARQAHSRAAAHILRDYLTRAASKK